MIDFLNLMRAALARIVQEPLPVVPVPARVVSFEDMEHRFLALFEIGVQGSSLFLRPRAEKKFIAQADIPARFVKNYLIEKELSQLFTKDLVDSFKCWLLIGASAVRAEEKE